MKTEIFEQLLDVSRMMAENRVLEPLLDIAMEVAIDLVDAEYGYMILVDEDGKPEFRVGVDLEGNKLEGPENQISFSIFEGVMQNRESVVIADAVVDPKFEGSESVAALKVRSVMCAPLVARGEVLGAIYVENRAKRNVFQKDDLKPLEYLAAQAAVAIQNAMLFNELERRVASRTIKLAETNQELKSEIEVRKLAEKSLHKLASTDSLTNIYNRRQFFELADVAYGHTRMMDNDLSILLFDIDNFKLVNDTYGHKAGDEILQQLAIKSQDVFRQGDIFARYGGEEFVVLLLNTNLETANLISERLITMIRETDFETTAGNLSVSISIGVSNSSMGEDLNLDNMLELADQALYKAKANGRDRVEVMVRES